jgi:parallel beta-helix repeat protein
LPLLETAGCEPGGGGVFVDPGDGVTTGLRQALLDGQPNGTRFCLNDGIHPLDPAEDGLNPKQDQIIQATHYRAAVISGAQPLSGWTPDGSGHWWAPISFAQPALSGICNSGTACQYTQDVYRNGVWLVRELSVAAVGPGDYFTDYAAGRVYVGDDPAGATVQIARSLRAINTFNRFQLRYTVVDGFATPAQHAAVYANSPTNISTIVGNEVRNSHAWAVAGIGSVVGATGTFPAGTGDGNYLHHNGQGGITFGGTNDQIHRNDSSYNNQAGFKVDWEAGGMKFTGCSGMDITGNAIHHNRGTGLWFDIDCNSPVVTDNTVEYNQDNGIEFEISDTADIHSNTVRGNGCGFGHVWSAQILTSNGANSNVYSNTVDTTLPVGIACDPADPNSTKRVVHGIVVYNDATRTPQGNNVKIGLDLLGGAAGNTVTENATGYDPGWSGEFFFNGTNPTGVVWNHNTYDVVDPATDTRWRITGLVTFAAWQAAGRDLMGSVG